NTIKVWNYENGEQARTIQGHGKQVTPLLFKGATPEFITVSGDQTVRMWNVDNGGQTPKFGGEKQFFYRPAHPPPRGPGAAAARKAWCGSTTARTANSSNRSCRRAWRRPRSSDVHFPHGPPARRICKNYNPPAPASGCRATYLGRKSSPGISLSALLGERSPR